MDKPSNQDRNLAYCVTPHGNIPVGMSYGHLLTTRPEDGHTQYEALDLSQKSWREKESQQRMLSAFVFPAEQAQKSAPEQNACRCSRMPSAKNTFLQKDYVPSTPSNPKDVYIISSDDDSDVEIGESSIIPLAGKRQRTEGTLFTPEEYTTSTKTTKSIRANSQNSSGDVFVNQAKHVERNKKKHSTNFANIWLKSFRNESDSQTHDEDTQRNGTIYNDLRMTEPLATNEYLQSGPTTMNDTNGDPFDVICVPRTECVREPGNPQAHSNMSLEEEDDSHGTTQLVPDVIGHGTKNHSHATIPHHDHTNPVSSHPSHNTNTTTFTNNPDISNESLVTSLNSTFSGNECKEISESMQSTQKSRPLDAMLEVEDVEVKYEQLFQNAMVCHEGWDDINVESCGTNAASSEKSTHSAKTPIPHISAASQPTPISTPVAESRAHLRHSLITRNTWRPPLHLEIHSGKNKNNPDIAEIPDSNVCNGIRRSESHSLLPHIYPANTHIGAKVITCPVTHCKKPFSTVELCCQHLKIHTIDGKISKIVRTETDVIRLEWDIKNIINSTHIPANSRIGQSLYVCTKLLCGAVIDGIVKYNKHRDCHEVYSKMCEIFHTKSMFSSNTGHENQLKPNVSSSSSLSTGVVSAFQHCLNVGHKHHTGIQLHKASPESIVVDQLPDDQQHSRSRSADVVERTNSCDAQKDKPHNIPSRSFLTAKLHPARKTCLQHKLRNVASKFPHLFSISQENSDSMIVAENVNTFHGQAFEKIHGKSGQVRDGCSTGNNCTTTNILEPGPGPPQTQVTTKALSDSLMSSGIVRHNQQLTPSDSSEKVSHKKSASGNAAPVIPAVHYQETRVLHNTMTTNPVGVANVANHGKTCYTLVLPPSELNNCPCPFVGCKKSGFLTDIIQHVYDCDYVPQSQFRCPQNCYIEYASRAELVLHVVKRHLVSQLDQTLQNADTRHIATVPLYSIPTDTGAPKNSHKLLNRQKKNKPISPATQAHNGTTHDTDQINAVSSTTNANVPTNAAPAIDTASTFSGDTSLLKTHSKTQEISDKVDVCGKPNEKVGQKVESKDCNDQLSSEMSGRYACPYSECSVTFDDTHELFDHCMNSTNHKKVYTFHSTHEKTRYCNGDTGPTKRKRSGGTIPTASGKRNKDMH